MGDCAHFVLNPTTLQLIPHYSSQTVTVQAGDLDRYGRTVGEVLLPDGRSLNRELVKAGFAWWYRRYAPDDETLEQLEEALERFQPMEADEKVETPPPKSAG